jgi:hypothetical protein
MSPNTLTTLLVDTAAVYRLTKLVTEDYLTEDLRKLVQQHFPAVLDKYTGLKRKHKLVYFINCPWCVSIWAAAFIFTLRQINPTLATYLSSILAASAVTGIAAIKGI